MRLIPHSANRFTKKSLTLSFIFWPQVLLLLWFRYHGVAARVSDGGHQSVFTLPRI
jgi:hypothetical protein